MNGAGREIKGEGPGFFHTLRRFLPPAHLAWSGLICLSHEAAPFPAAAAEQPDPPALAHSPVKPIAPGLFQLGDVRLDQNRRTVVFPAVINMTGGNIEYVLVTTTGKTHESLLRTQASPLDIQLALLLLGAKGTTNALPEDPAQPLPGDGVEIEVSWNATGRLQRFRVEEFVTDRKAGNAMRRGPWTYNGSRLRPDGFAAMVDGSIVSLITDADALINNPRRGREDDDNWLIRTNGLPALNSAVEVTIRLGAASQR
jgi:hypothetical protein